MHSCSSFLVSSSIAISIPDFSPFDCIDRYSMAGLILSPLADAGCFYWQMR